MSRPRGRRLVVGLVALAFALVLGHLVTTYAGSTRESPFVRSGEVGSRVDLEYVDLTVREVAPAKRLLGPISTATAVQASDVFVVAVLAFTPTREPTQLLTVVLVDDEDRVYRVSKKASCEEYPRAPTGVTSYVMVCFDVPSSRLAGMRLRLGRGDIADDGRRDEVAEVDLGISAEDEDDWAATTSDYAVQSPSFEPMALEAADIVEGPEP